MLKTSWELVAKAWRREERGAAVIVEEVEVEEEEASVVDA